MLLLSLCLYGQLSCVILYYTMYLYILITYEGYKTQWARMKLIQIKRILPRHLKRFPSKRRIYIRHTQSKYSPNCNQIDYGHLYPRYTKTWTQREDHISFVIQTCQPKQRKNFSPELCPLHITNVSITILKKTNTFTYGVCLWTK